jgi:hypothetical protein
MSDPKRSEESKKKIAGHIKKAMTLILERSNRVVARAS